VTKTERGYRDGWKRKRGRGGAALRNMTSRGLSTLGLKKDQGGVRDPESSFSISEKLRGKKGRKAKSVITKFLCQGKKGEGEEDTHIIPGCATVPEEVVLMNWKENTRYMALSPYEEIKTNATFRRDVSQGPIEPI